MKIAEVDAFYLAMPTIELIADGTQDTFLVRVRTDTGLEAWGESDASPLVALACYCCPPSHSNIVNLRDSLLGSRLDSVDDLHGIRARALRRALDIQNVHHAYSAADIALWDLLGQQMQLPVWALLDGESARTHPKLPYASSLFGDDPETTRRRAVEMRAAGYAAAKFASGPFGHRGRAQDCALVAAARNGLGDDSLLFIDACCAWGEDATVAAERLEDLLEFDVEWLEEPLLPDSMEAYASLAAHAPRTRIAAGESSGHLRDARDFVLHGHVDVLQIDAGRIGGITPAHQVRRLAEERRVSYLNHTFKSHLSLAAALHVFATVEEFELLEWAVGGSPLAYELVADPLQRRPDGRVVVTDRPGLGVVVDLATVRRYHRPVEIRIDGVALELNVESP